MASSLVPCPSCARHVRATERACPFCRSALSASLGAKVIPGATQRLSRAAAFTFATTLAATGCLTLKSDGVDASTADLGSPADTGATTDRGTDTGATTDTGTTPDTGVRPDAGVPNDDGGFLAMYGGPPQDSGVDSGAPDDNGGIAPLYGLPAPDAGA